MFRDIFLLSLGIFYLATKQNGSNLKKDSPLIIVPPPPPLFFSSMEGIISNLNSTFCTALIGPSSSSNLPVKADMTTSMTCSLLVQI